MITKNIYRTFRHRSQFRVILKKLLLICIVNISLIESVLANNLCSEIFIHKTSPESSFYEKLPPSQVFTWNIDQIPLDLSQKPGLNRQSLRILIWNIHKNKDPNLSTDLAQIGEQADLLLLQEAVNTQEFIMNLRAGLPGTRWSQTNTFTRNDVSTGVATGSRVTPLTEKSIISKVTEPVLNTPKSILLSLFKINSEKPNPPSQDANSAQMTVDDLLLVANIHAINFVSNETFQKHIQQLVTSIKNHKGPLIVGGDFNTWNERRMQILFSALMDLDLKWVKVPRKGFLDLDHLFVRGLKPRMAFPLHHINSSDHQPILVDLDFEK